MRYIRFMYFAPHIFITFLIFVIHALLSMKMYVNMFYSGEDIHAKVEQIAGGIFGKTNLYRFVMSTFLWVLIFHKEIKNLLGNV